MLVLFRTVFALVLGALTLLPMFWCRAAQAKTIGNPLISGPNEDTCQTCLFINNQPFNNQPFTLGQVTTWSFYSTNPIDSVTPVLFTRSGNTFTISGIGTPENGGTNVVSTFNFGLVSGTDIITNASYFGWID